MPRLGRARRPSVLVATIATSVTLAGAASAQPAVGAGPGGAKLQWSVLGPAKGEPTGRLGEEQRDALLGFEPLRLGMANGAMARFSGDGECGSVAESPGLLSGPVSGPPPSVAFAVRLVPRLTIFGLQRTGECALRNAAGVGFSYVVPLTPNVLFAVSGGALFLPNAGMNGGSVSRAGLRTDVIFKRSEGRSFSVGVGTSGVLFGGVF